MFNQIISVNIVGFLIVSIVLYYEHIHTLFNVYERIDAKTVSSRQYSKTKFHG
jgi:hypothetical protein